MLHVENIRNISFVTPKSFYSIEEFLRAGVAMRKEVKELAAVE